MIELMYPDWPAPPTVRAAFTLRRGGVSRPPYDSLNLGAHTGDELAAVEENRRRVRAALQLPTDPAWLAQQHGASVVALEGGAGGAARLGPSHPDPDELPRADAAFTRQPGQVCAIQVADCMPVLFAARDGAAVAAAHAGWRGLAAGVLEATVAALRGHAGGGGMAPDELIAWLGPAIGPEHFEVGEEVRAAFLEHDPAAGRAFLRNARGRWQCDLYALARARLAAAGVQDVYGGGWSTYGDRTRFFSYRRDGRCGRMGALVWIEP